MTLLLPARSLTTLDTIHCMSAERLLTALPDSFIDLIVTSPPYDNLRTYNGHHTFDFPAIARQSYRVLKPGGVLVWIVGDSTFEGNESLTSFRQAIGFQEVGFKVWDTMIWNKFLPGDFGKRYCQSFEYMFVFAKETVKTFNPIMRKNLSAGKLSKKNQRSGYITDNGHVQTGGTFLIKDTGVMENVWRIQPSATEIDHPATFPEELAERHILSWSNVGDIVLDFFGGSGTVAKMARANGRHYITSDISAEYCGLMEKRLGLPFTLPMFETMGVAV